MTDESNQPGCQFASDNTAGVCPSAAEAIDRANVDAAAPYGADRWTARAIELIRELFETDCEVFFTFNGTAANALALATMCRPYHCVVAHRLAHVETDECGAPEFFSGGSKVVAVDGDDGRLETDAVEQAVRSRRDVHFPKARVLSVTQSTELGTVYDLAALSSISQLAGRLDLRLHMDGARLANAVARLGVAPKDLTWERGVDVLCLGGTKNGMAVGDCVIFFDQTLAAEFDYRCKQAGQLASKMRFLSAPWVGMLESGAWLDNARHACAMASRLAERLEAIASLRIVAPVESNAIFVKFPDGAAERLRERGWVFYEFPGAEASRLMCSWATTQCEIDHFVEHVAAVCP